MDPQTLLSELADLEGQIPIPPAIESIDMGVWDARRGEWNGVSQIEFDPSIPGSTFHPPIPGIVETRSRRALLVFRIKGATRSTTLTVAGRRRTVPAGSDRIVAGPFNVPRGRTRWAITTGTRSHADLVVIEKVPVVAAGCFELPILPVSVLYEPPQLKGAEASNFASYTETHQTALTTGFTSSKKTTRTIFEKPASVGTVLKSLAPLAAKIPRHGEAIAGAFNAIGNGLGSREIEQSTTHAAYHGRSLTVADSATEISTTRARKGPGLGDQLFFLRDVKVAWVFNDGSLHMTVVSHGTPDAREVQEIQEDLRSPLDASLRDGWRALLSLDPFVENPANPRLDPKRFHHLGPKTISNREFTKEISSGEIRRTSKARSRSTLTITRVRSGWLSHFGLGETEDSDTRVEASFTVNRDSQTSVEKTGTVTFHPVPDLEYKVDLFHDELSNTIAARVKRFEGPRHVFKLTPGVVELESPQPGENLALGEFHVQLIDQFVGLGVQGSIVISSSDANRVLFLIEPGNINTITAGFSPTIPEAGKTFGVVHLGGPGATAEFTCFEPPNAETAQLEIVAPPR